MLQPTVLLCLLTMPAHAADPPDWYAHIPTEQRAALLAARNAQLGHAALAAPGVHASRGAASGGYSVPRRGSTHLHLCIRQGTTCSTGYGCRTESGASCGRTGSPTDARVLML
jgi:hypothetical protein